MNKLVLSTLSVAAMGMVFLAEGQPTLQIKKVIQ